jgi:hypothetical protein
MEKLNVVCHMKEDLTVVQQITRSPFSWNSKDHCEVILP